MAKISLPTAPNGNGLRNVVNSNFDAIENALNNGVLWRDNPTGEPNSMKQDIDMDGNDLLNVGQLYVDSILVDGQNYEDTLTEIVDLAKNEVALAKSEVDLAKAEVDLARSESDRAKNEADRSRDEADRSMSYIQASQASAAASASSAQDAKDQSVLLREFLDDYAQEILYFPLDLGFITDAPVIASYDLGELL